MCVACKSVEYEVDRLMWYEIVSASDNDSMSVCRSKERCDKWAKEPTFIGTGAFATAGGWVVCYCRHSIVRQTSIARLGGWTCSHGALLSQ